ncbi:MAG: Uncharacterised protein [Glaciecola sp. HTCC2999]|jgi:phage shock protein PspC (stress-responsive transcriptional regulator)|nr:MAG: Uncharacterised protein [Glaciecola sp. HTCC2999]
MRESYSINRLYRDGRRAMISGLCAGVARHLAIHPNWVRGITLVTFMLLPFAVGLAYVLGVCLVKTRQF